MTGIRDWYNGYSIGGRVAYNPWSIIQYVANPGDGLKQKGIIIEIKSPYLDKNKSLEDALQEAAEQIVKRNYAQEMFQQGVDEIIQLAVAVLGKEVLVEGVAVI